MFCTVPLPPPEYPMRHAEYRYLYRPSRYRAPDWLHRLWAWL